MESLDNRFQKQLEFIFEIDKVKSIIRKTKLFDGSRLENDAEHSWHLALMAITLSEYANEKIDLLRVVKMVLIHDLVEIDAGDVFVYDKARADQYEKEEIAAQRIFGILPQDQFQEYHEIWKEFENKNTIESKFANALDRIEPLLQNYKNKGASWKDNKISINTVLNRNEPVSHGSEYLWDRVKEILNECISLGYLKNEYTE